MLKSTMKKVNNSMYSRTSDMTQDDMSYVTGKYTWFALVVSQYENQKYSSRYRLKTD